MRLASLTLLLAAAALAQPKTVEVFGNIGFIHLMEDEGTLGNAPAYGGSAIIGLTRRWAVDFDVMTAYHSRQYAPVDYFRIRRTVIAPAMLARWGSERAYGFLGGGVGAQIDRSEYAFRSYSGMPPVETGVTHVNRTAIPAWP